MEDYLFKVLEATTKRTLFISDESRTNFSLISYATLSIDSADSIRKFQKWIKKEYGVTIRVVGGGYGCTRIDFEVISESTEKASDFIKKVISDHKFHEKAYEIGFKVLIIKNPWLRINLVDGSIEGDIARIKKGDLKMNVDKSVHVDGPVTNSNITAHSSSTNQTISINSKTDKILDKIIKHAKTNNNISKEEYIMILNQIQELKEEITKPNPRNNVIERILSNLSNIASISSFVNEVMHFLPK